MAAQQCLPLLCVILAGILAEPAPGRIPKVYNALITSSQNLEPSKAYPVYQPVLHSAFPFPLQTIVYGDIPITNGIIPTSAVAPTDATPKPEDLPSSTSEPPVNSESPQKSSESETSSPVSENDKAAPAPSIPESPKTESPIPLNEFGLPPQILPIGIGHISPSYHYTQFTVPYTYPGLRFYDPYYPFGFHPYAGLPLYQPLTNILGTGLPISPVKAESPIESPAPKVPDSQSPPSEPSDLNVLNYASKDPAIPNVPPPPLPQGGLRVDKE